MSSNIELPVLDARTPDERAAAVARIAMNGLDVWLAEAERALVGRKIVRTGERDPHRGAVCEITRATVAWGASGYHLFVVATLRARYDTRTGVRLEPWWRRGGNNDLLEIGVTCELLAHDE